MLSRARRPSAVHYFAILSSVGVGCYCDNCHYYGDADQIELGIERTYVQTYYLYNTVAYGANDIETWHDPATGYTSPSSHAYAWRAGSASVGAPAYINFGSADGCPQNTSFTCSWGWNQGDYYNFGKALNALVAPEIYVTSMAGQWYYVSAYGGGGGIVPQGPLDEHDLDGNTLDSGPAWTALNARFPTMYYSLQIHGAS